MPEKKFTLAHITHEAVEQIGGIGTVLEGLMTSAVYQDHVKRSILVGPTESHFQVDPESRLGEHGKVLYSSIDQIDRAGLSAKLAPVEWAFDVKFVYGRRRYQTHGSNSRTGEAEVLLIDVFHANRDRLNVFKFKLWEMFGLDSGKYDSSWDYEEWVRLAEPAYYALVALLNDDDFPGVLFSHEFMGMPTALAAIVEASRTGHLLFRTVFHGHECATARRLVEDHPGHDTMFYNVLEQARQRGLYVNDVFQGLDANLRHALVSRAHLCDGVIAVGDYTRDEMAFLNEHFDEQPIDVVYNGVPANKPDMAYKHTSRRMLLDYSSAILGYEPDVLMTHVTRPVISKGLWRDMKVCHELDAQLAAMDKTAVLYLLTTGGGVRRAADVEAMEHAYGWPRHHRLGYPDLVGPEQGINHDVENFNKHHRAVQIVLVNQFGWSRARIGKHVPKEMNMGHFRCATDVEFGMATYEPFGISPLEPLESGAICVISNVCGCEGFVEYVTEGKPTPNVIKADFTRLDEPHDLEQALNIGRDERDAIEQRVAVEVAEQIIQRLPWDDAARTRLLTSGHALVDGMGWDQVVEQQLLPMLNRIRTMPMNNGAKPNNAAR